MGKVKIAVETLGLEDGFLEYSTDFPSSGNYLTNWKNDGEIVVWLHPKQEVLPLWSHPWFVVSQEKDEDGDEIETIRMRSFNCFEVPGILNRQNLREDSHERKYPPQVCPFDMFIEWVHQQVVNEHLGLYDEVLKIEAQGEDPRVFYAGGLTGIFNQIARDKDEAELRRMRKLTGITGKDAFKQAMAAKLQFIFSVVPHDPKKSEGCAITWGAKTLGQRIQGIFRRRVEQEKPSNEELPYAIKWKHDPTKAFSDKYDALEMEQLEMPEHVKKAFEQAPPDLEPVKAAYNLYAFRRELESYACVEMPIAEFFEPIEKHFDIDTTDPDYDDDEGDEEGDEESRGKAESKKRTPEVDTKPKSKLKPKREEEAEEEPEEEEAETDESEEEEDTACIVCDGDMGDDFETCRHCSAKYEIKGDEAILVSRQCANEDCMERYVEIEENGGGICPQCGAEHDEDWNFEMPKKTVRKKLTKKKMASNKVANKARESARAVARRGG